jgi:hypothetical protein
MGLAPQIIGPDLPAPALGAFTASSFAPMVENLDAVERKETDDGFFVEKHPDGTIYYGSKDEETAAEGVKKFTGAEDKVTHFRNLAEEIPESVLRKLGENNCELIDADKKSRANWESRFTKGLMLMGVNDAGKGEGANFTGSSKAIHPVMAEAVVQFSSRAIAEVFPATGPVKAVINGEENDDLRGQRDRIQEHMNFQYTVEIEEAFDETDTMLFRLALEGSAFKKVYYNKLLERACVDFVSATDIIVPFNAKNLRSAARVTHSMGYSANEIKHLQLVGHFRDVDLQPPTGNDADGPSGDVVIEQIKKGEGREDTTTTAADEDQFDHRVYETAMYLDLEGFEHKKFSGENSGLKLPYIVTIEKESMTVLAIRRNYAFNDKKYKKLEYLTHYKYLPGLGFYGYGLLHMIGSLTDAANGSLRALLDSAQFANMQGGFRSKGSRIKTGDFTIAPGEWKEAEGTIEDLQKAFFSIPYKEPSNVLFQLMGSLTELARRFASTTEAMVGEAANTGPVGTTLALIEQGSKVFSSIHRRIHRAQALEFKCLHRVNANTLPQQKFFAPGKPAILRADYEQSEIDVIPVSDPNIFSDTQRIAQGQAIDALTKDAAPGMFDLYEVKLDMLGRMKVPTGVIARVLPDPDALYFRMGPVDEAMAMLYGRPVRAYPEQDHEAHIAAHMTWMQQLPPELQQIGQATVLAHIAEHHAWKYRMQIQNMLGVELPPPPNYAKRRLDLQGFTPLPIELENKIAMLTAQASAQMQPQQAQEQKTPEQIKAEMKAAIDEAKAQADETRKAVAFDNEERRKDEKHARDLQRAAEEDALNDELKDGETAAEILRKTAKDDATQRKSNQAGTSPAG